MENFKFFQNKACEYFPCHEVEDVESFNCLFCFCPLYALGERCGGDFCYTERGDKDCSGCTRPHRAGNYEEIIRRLPGVMKLVRKQPEKE